MAVIAIVVTYRRPAELRVALEAVRSQTMPPSHIVVVDNDPSTTLEPRRDPSLIYIGMSENVGPAGGFAIGMQRALELAADADWLALVDDDDPPPSATMIEHLLEAAERAAAVGAPAAAVGMVGTRFDLRRGRARRVPDQELTRDLVDVDWIAGGQLPLYSAAAVRRVGVFDADLFFGFEELEYGLRLRAAGERLIVPGAIARKRREDSGRLGLGSRVPSRGGIAWRRYYSTRNLVLITRRYSTRSAALQALVRSGIGGAARSLLVLRRPDLAAASLRGAWDARRGRVGRTIMPTEARKVIHDVRRQRPEHGNR